MLNQLIGVSGTIVAAIIGFIALIVNNAKSNRHALELEKLRIEAEEAREKAKRNAAIIEEVYTLLTNINVRCIENIQHGRPFMDNILDDLYRIQTLISLYIPSLKEIFHSLNSSLLKLASLVYVEQQNNSPPQVWKNVSEAFNGYRERLDEIKSELEKLVR